MHEQPVSFPNWKVVLAQSGLSEPMQRMFEREIIAFLRHCKVTRAPATVSLIRHYLDKRESIPSGPAHEALRWFFKTARLADPPSASVPTLAANPERPRGVRSSMPPPAAIDLGGMDWEKALIAASRKAGFLWRTEETYRAWAWRFARFIAPRSPFSAGDVEVEAFLTALAVDQRASSATQKQALNALVFFLQEALHCQLGELNFRRAAARRRVPTVLTRAECEGLFGEMSGTFKLMAELMYGSGLRLMELLRLRVHHLDLPRRRLQIYAGKGDKDRVTVLSDRLVRPLTDHIERLRHLYENDRKNGLAGVWLPEGLAGKYPRAGEKWEWPRKHLRRRG